MEDADRLVPTAHLRSLVKWLQGLWYSPELFDLVRSSSDDVNMVPFLHKWTPAPPHDFKELTEYAKRKDLLESFYSVGESNMSLMRDILKTVAQVPWMPKLPKDAYIPRSDGLKGSSDMFSVSMGANLILTDAMMETLKPLLETLFEDDDEDMDEKQVISRFHRLKEALKDLPLKVGVENRFDLRRDLYAKIEKTIWQWRTRRWPNFGIHLEAFKKWFLEPVSASEEKKSEPAADDIKDAGVLKRRPVDPDASSSDEEEQDKRGRRKKRRKSSKSKDKPKVKSKRGRRKGGHSIDKTFRK